MRPYMTTQEFWLSTFERSVKTFAQAAVALIGTGAAGVTELDWAQIGSVSLVAAIVSVLTSLASDRIGQPGPSLVKEAVEVPVEVTAASAPFVYPTPSMTGPDNHTSAHAGQPIDYRP